MIADDIARQLNRDVSDEEVQAAVAGPIGTDEREEFRALVRWFTTRYPTAEERLAYVRQAHKRWTAVGKRS